MDGKKMASFSRSGRWLLFLLGEFEKFRCVSDLLFHLLFLSQLVSAVQLQQQQQQRSTVIQAAKVPVGLQGFLSMRAAHTMDIHSATENLHSLWPIIQWPGRACTTA